MVNWFILQILGWYGDDYGDGEIYMGMRIGNFLCGQDGVIYCVTF